MKELNQNIKEKTEIQIQKKQQIERELIDQLLPHPGHTIWEIDKITLEVQQAMFIKKDFIFAQEDRPKNEVLYRQGYAYVAALSKKTALKKYKQGKNGSKETVKDPLTLSIY